MLEYPQVALAFMNHDHAEFIEMREQLLAALAKEGNHAEVDALLDRLLEHTRTHFGEEERLMEAAGYDDLAAHRQSHRIMAEHVRALERTYDHDPSTVAAAELHGFLSDWLVHHIRSEDSRYVACLSGHLPSMMA